ATVTRDFGFGSRQITLDPALDVLWCRHNLFSSQIFGQLSSQTCPNTDQEYSNSREKETYKK
ncbi:MAG: hypothetical protein VX749_09130, partial [Pseudomonadota bacterium]|nr:hypothetical protein [Pseudomonadota bacterium]